MFLDIFFDKNCIIDTNEREGIFFKKSPEVAPIASSEKNPAQSLPHRVLWIRSHLGYKMPSFGG